MMRRLVGPRPGGRKQSELFASFRRGVWWSALGLILAAFSFAAGTQPQPAAPPADAPAVEYKQFTSKKLGRELRYGVQLPPSYHNSTRRYPVLIFLHGRFENERRWEERGAAAIAQRLRAEGKIGEMIVVAPFGGGSSFYTDTFDGKEPWEQMLVTDLVEHIDQSFRTAGGPKGRVIGGISMGGYGALKIAFRHPEKFAAVIAHSPALLLSIPPKPEGIQPGQRSYYQVYTPVFGDPINEELWQSNDPLVLGKRNADRLRRSGIKIYFDCGTEDRFLFFNGAKALDKVLTEAQVPHEFHLFPGGHGWEYARTVLDRSLAFAWQSVK